jgi:dihydroorotase
VLLEAGAFSARGGRRQRGAALGLTALAAEGWLLAPCLVDPHSQLEDPWLRQRRNPGGTLERSAIAAGYGTVALLPPRPQLARPARSGCSPWPAGPLQWLLWGSFSRGGEGQELAAHGDQLAAGAIGLAEADRCPPLPLLERGLNLGEFGRAPLLLAPRDAALSLHGFVREGVEALRAGWPPDPVVSETVPLQSLLALARHHGGARLQLMNLSTAAAGGVAGGAAPGGAPLRRRSAGGICWRTAPASTPWRRAGAWCPLGTPADRLALLAALAEGLISAVAVHHQAIDREEYLLPLDQRKPGVAGHRFVLPCLWRELVRGGRLEPAAALASPLFRPGAAAGAGAPTAATRQPALAAV